MTWPLVNRVERPDFETGSPSRQDSIAEPSRKQDGLSRFQSAIPEQTSPGSAHAVAQSTRLGAPLKSIATKRSSMPI